MKIEIHFKNTLSFASVLERKKITKWLKDFSNTVMDGQEAGYIQKVDFNEASLGDLEVAYSLHLKE